VRFILVPAILLQLAAQQYTIGELERRTVPARDGVHLTTVIYRPLVNGAPAPGRFPVIVARTPYGADGIDVWARYFVPRGYVAVGQNVRGRYGSGGRWRPNSDDGADGADLTRWIGQQPWYLPEDQGGGIGTVGTSYEGSTQHAMAIAGAPNLKTMIPVDAMSNYGRYGIRHNGAFELRFLNWIFCLGNNPSRNRVGDFPGYYPVEDPGVLKILRGLPERVPEFVRMLPLRAGTTPLKLVPDYEKWLIEAMSHGDYDRYWKDMGASVVDHLTEFKDIPVLHVTGWYDTWTTQAANLNFVELSRTKKSPQRLLVGPWVHGGQTASVHGEADFGSDAALDFNAVRLRWFEHHLRGVRNGVESDPPVRLFVMGPGQSRKTTDGRVMVGGRWRNENEWPLKRAVPTAYYAHAGGVLSPAAPPTTAEPLRYLFDPKNPVPTVGGSLSSEGMLAPRGAMDQRCRPDLWACNGSSMRLSQRNDVLVFQTAPLDRDTEVTGRLIVKLWASSNAPDTDFTAKLADVYPPSPDFPEGVELNVSDSIVRARYRHSLERAEMMRPGQPYEFTIEMYPSSLVFGKGHRIRLDISSSNFPRFDINPNTGEPLNNNRRWAVAENTVYLDRSRPTRILLPLVP